MIHKDNKNPEGRYIPPDRRIFTVGSSCKTRQMTEEEREKYGEPNPVKRQTNQYAEREAVYIVTQEDRDFAAKVRAERAKRGLTLVAFGKLCGVSGTTISKIERFGGLPNKKTKNKINKYFGWEDDAIDE